MILECSPLPSPTSTLSLFVPLVSSYLILETAACLIYTKNYMFKNLIVFLWLNIFEGLGKRETFALAKSGIDATFAEDEVKQQLGLIFDSASPEYV